MYARNMCDSSLESSVGGSASERRECRADLFGEELGLFEGREVTALVDLVPVDELAIAELGPTARRSVDFAREDGHADRDVDVDGEEREVGVLPMNYST